MRLSLRLYIIFFVLLALILGLCILLFSNNQQDTVILLAPESLITKVKPVEPGGAEFLNMDKSVYDYISTVRKSNKEYVMPEPEKPIMLLQNRHGSSIFDHEIISQNNPSKDSIFDIPEIILNSQLQDGLNIVFIDQADHRLTSTDSNQAAKASNYQLKIYTAKTEQQAIDQWQKISKLNSVIIGNQDYKIVKTDLGDKGIIYNIYIGPFNNFNTASAMCKKLIKNKQSCIIVNN